MDETTGLPEDEVTQPVPTPTPPAPAPVPSEKPKQKTDVGFLLLGLVSPLVVNLIIGGIGAAVTAILPDATSGAFSALYALSAVPMPVMFVVVLVAFLVGKQRDNVRLMSFGKGGLIAYAIGALLLLLAFGSCVVIGAGGGLLGG